MLNILKGSTKDLTGLSVESCVFDWQLLNGSNDSLENSKQEANKQVYIFF